MKAVIEKTKRNQSLYQDYLSKKLTTVEMVTKYNITPARIYQIIKMIKRKGGEKLNGR